MSSSTYNLHGLTIAVHGGSPAWWPILQALPEAADGARAELAIELEEAVVAEAEIEALLGSPPLFFHGRTRAVEHRLGIALTDGYSRVIVDSNGAHIRGVVDRRSLEDGYTFAHTTLFIALMVALRAHGFFHLHAGALIDGTGRTILVAGEGGTGKTTTTLALLRAGCAYLGDDAVLLSNRTGAARVYQLPKSFHADARTAEAFPELASVLGPEYRENHGKRAFDPARVYSGRARAEAERPSLIFYTRIAEEAATRVHPLSQGEALGELAACGALVMVVPGTQHMQEQLAVLREVSSHARAFQLWLGRDVFTAPEQLARRLFGA